MGLVVVVGCGNAALCAALAAREQGADVVVLERAPQAERGGNSAFTAGIVRFAFDGIDDLRALVPGLTDAEATKHDYGRYPEAQFFADMARVTEHRADPDLTEVLVKGSYGTLRWMATKGVRFQPSYNRQAYNVDGMFTFWGGLALEVDGGGPGLIDALTAAAGRDGVDVRYNTRAVALLADDGGVRGVRIRTEGRTSELRADAVVLASGGFEANAAWRTSYLGPGWDLAKVRGTRFNTGDGIAMALAIGAMPYGNWSGCHSVGWDRNAPEFGDLAVGDGFQKHSYPLGIMVNAHGDRFVDEGADFRNFTYAKYGRAILEQPQQFAWQVFDGQVTQLLRDEYRIRQVTKVTADSIAELAGKLDGVDPIGFARTIDRFNAAVQTEVPFNPNVMDGRGTAGLPVPKTNWANALLIPPFEAYQVTCGITFTFGGLRVTPSDAQVVDTDGDPMHGLYAAGELVGGLFYFNYPGGAGLTSGAVFGRLAGAAAGAQANGSRRP